MPPAPPVNIPKPPAPPSEPEPKESVTKPEPPTEEMDYDPLNLPKPPAPKTTEPPAPPADDEDEHVDYNPLSFTTNSYKNNEASGTPGNYNQNRNSGYQGGNQNYQNRNQGYQGNHQNYHGGYQDDNSGYQNNNNQYRGPNQGGMGGNRVGYGMNNRGGPMAHADELFSRSIFISGLNYDSREEDIYHLFSQCGEIKEMNIPKYQDTQRNIGYGHITFSSPEEKAKV